VSQLALNLFYQLHDLHQSRQHSPPCAQSHARIGH
jgi:hypothetical protein